MLRIWVKKISESCPKRTQRIKEPYFTDCIDPISKNFRFVKGILLPSKIFTGLSMEMLKIPAIKGESIFDCFSYCVHQGF